MLTDKQKLQFLEKLLQENMDIKREYEKYKKSFEKRKSSSENNFEELIEDIFSQFEDIDTQDYISYECYYDYEYMYDEVLEDIMEDFKSVVFDKLENKTLYDTIFYLFAINEALLREPVIEDDMFILGDDYIYAFAYYLETEIIQKVAKKLENKTIFESEKEEIIKLIFNLKKDYNLNLEIFTSILRILIDDKNIANICSKNIELFPAIIGMHIYDLLEESESYINLAKKAYLQDREVAVKLLEKLNDLNRYSEYIEIAESLFKNDASYFAPIALKVVDFNKNPIFYKQLLAQKCFDNENIKDFIKLKRYLNLEELDNFVNRVRNSYKREFLIEILKVEQKFEEILSIAKEIKYGSYRNDFIPAIDAIKSVYPQEVLEIVKNYCDKALRTEGRDRTTYQHLVKVLLQVINEPKIQLALKEYIYSNLYNHKPRLPALRDELQKGGLIDT